MTMPNDTTRRFPRTLREAFRNAPENCFGIEHEQPIDADERRLAEIDRIAYWVEWHVLPVVCAFALGVLVALL